MKRYTKRIGIACFAAFMLCIAASADAQTIQLRFTGKQAGQYLQVDSIRVENLSQGCDTMLYWPDTVLILAYTGINGRQATEAGFGFSRPFPQPFLDYCTFDLYIPSAGQLALTLSDQSGRRLHAFTDHLQAGTHSFRFLSGQAQVCLVQARMGSQIQSLRLISAGGMQGPGSSLEYQGRTGDLPFIKATASTASVFCFSPGNTLLCLGFAAGDTAGFADVPLVNTDYTFTFEEGYPCPLSPVLSYGGQLYQTVQIGNQCWMRQNLNIGTMVLSTTSISSHSDCSNNGIIEKYCHDNDPANCTIYGGLYDWDEMMGYTTTPGVQGICPAGWHIPTDGEWCILTTFLDPTVDCNIWDWSGTNAGGKMKETGFTHWYSPNTGATNESGFTALPGGYRSHFGYFYDIGGAGDWWSSSEGATSGAVYRNLAYSDAGVGRYYYLKTYGFSVRCLRDN